MNRAACRGMDTSIFFPPKNDYTVAVGICEACEVKSECLELALNASSDDYGMFGGLTPGERDVIRWDRIVHTKGWNHD